MDLTIENLCQELANGAQVLRVLASGLSQAEARFKPSQEARSVLEVIAHLYDEEREDFRRRIDITLHQPGQEWPPIDPDGWVIQRNYNMRDFNETLRDFLAEREKSLAWLNSLEAPDWEARYNAPFGPISAGDLLASWVAHDNLHMRQLVELRRERLEKMAAAYQLRYAGEW
jgi:hypothetical protein